MVELLEYGKDVVFFPILDQARFLVTGDELRDRAKEQGPIERPQIDRSVRIVIAEELLQAAEELIGAVRDVDEARALLVPGVIDRSHVREGHEGTKQTVQDELGSVGNVTVFDGVVDIRDHGEPRGPRQLRPSLELSRCFVLRIELDPGVPSFSSKDEASSSPSSMTSSNRPPLSVLPTKWRVPER